MPGQSHPVCYTAPLMPPAPLTLILNADVHAPEPLGLCSLLLGGGRVLWLGEGRPQLDASLMVAQVDLQGRPLVPGLIDGHAHLTGGGGESGFASKVPAPMLTAYTLAGVTSVIGVLGTDDCTRSSAELLARTRALVEEGLSAWCLTGGYHVPPVTVTGSVRGDIVHVDRIIGMGELALSDHRSSQPTLDELLRLASDVHVAGLMTGKGGALHLHLGDGERGLALVREALALSELPARCFHPTHVNRREALFVEALAHAAAGGVIDLTAVEGDDDDEAGITAAAGFIRYQDAGLPLERLTISSDCGGCLPRFDAEGRVVHMEVGRSASLLACLRDLLGQGVALTDALAPFTSNVARHWRLPGKGRIAVGQDADLLAFGTGMGVSDLWAGGQRLVEDGCAVVKGRFET